MPSIPLVARETASYSRSTDQMCRQDSRVQVSVEEENAAEESLAIYCKPVEFYNIIQRRAIRNPTFLQRNLRYRIQAKHKRRIQLTITVSETVSDGTHGRTLFPLYVLLARRISDASVGEYSYTYRFNRACIITSAGVGRNTEAQATFVLPEMNKLASEAKHGSLAILLFSCVGTNNSGNGSVSSQEHLDKPSIPLNMGKFCLYGDIPLESLYSSWENSIHLSLGQRAEMTSTIDMHSSFSKWSCLNKEKCVSVQTPSDSGITRAQVQVNIYAEEFGAREKSPYNAYLSDAAASSSSDIIRLRTGNVIFNYRYHNNKLQRTEVTEDFSCPFCLVKCASFKGLRCHLSASHDLFHFEFWVTEEYQAVNVSVKTDIFRSEVVANKVDPQQQTFFFCSGPVRWRRRNLLQHAKYSHLFGLESDLSAFATEHLNKADAGDSLLPPAVLHFAKTRKISAERSDLRNRTLLQKRQFFHSHRAQPMEVEQVLSDRDSEDEVDDDVADFEDRRMLDDFVDVTKDEKQLMHMWNSFMRKQRVLADGHIPWACEAFTRLHGHDLVKAPMLSWCWRLFMIKLWNHSLLDARSMNACNMMLDQIQNPGSD